MLFKIHPAYILFHMYKMGQAKPQTNISETIT